MVQVVRAAGRIGIVGVHEPQDPQASAAGAKEGRYGFEFGTAFAKGIAFGTGQCPVKRYNRQLAQPSLIVSHEVSLDEAPEADDKFDKRIKGYTKVLLHPRAA